LTSRERQYLLDILLAAEQAKVFIAGRGESVLAEDVLIRAGVLHSLMIIGEAASRILKVENPGPLPDLPWRKMADLRNVIVHEYEGIQLGPIWRVLEHELPIVIETLTPLFPERPLS
jgi:uncharacterized protein with HEPN domain